jgi:hypothetical protein
LDEFGDGATDAVRRYRTNGDPVSTVARCRRTRHAASGLIVLKLSGNAQFQDRPRACKLIETAVSRVDRSMTPRLSECRAN